VGQVTVLELAERFRGGLDRLPQGMRARVDTALRTPFLVPNAFSPRLSAAKATLDTRLLALISERRKNPVARDDLLSRLLAAHDADGASMSDEQLRDESVTLFVAGHETTANALSWCFALLARHPEVRARLQAEVDALGGRAPGFHDVMRVPLAVRVFKEALRLYPPLTLLVRQAMEDFTITGVVPEGMLGSGVLRSAGGRSEFKIDQAAWERAGQPASLVLTTDRADAPEVAVPVKASEAVAMFRLPSAAESDPKRKEIWVAQDALVIKIDAGLPASVRSGDFRMRLHRESGMLFVHGSTEELNAVRTAVEALPADSGVRESTGVPPA
jgi:hypothetical protein